MKQVTGKAWVYLVEVIYLRNPTDNSNHNKKARIWIGDLIHSIQSKLYGNTNGFDTYNLQGNEASVNTYMLSQLTAVHLLVKAHLPLVIPLKSRCPDISGC
jgi:hypothetical protein